MVKNIYSFDVFDTCMIRACGKPENLFCLLAKEVVRYKDESLLRAFVMERRNAEKTAMLSLKKEAVTLSEIYDVFDLAPFTDMPKKQVEGLEINLELRSFLPIKDTVEKINSLRDKGHILFISDMYLPSEVIRQGLTSLGIMQEVDGLYVSGDVGLSKRTGRLFDYVAQAEGIRKSVWTHHGDNPHGDYLVPMRKGIKANLVRTAYSEYETLVENEAKFFPSPLAASTFAGLMHASRLVGMSDKSGFGADIMASLLVPFVDALLKDAIAKHIRRLYFASRDAYVMYLVAKELLPLCENLEIRYLHISTKSVYPASVQRADKEEISRLLENIGCFSPSKVMQMFDCTDKEMSKMGETFDLNRELRYGSAQADVFLEKLIEGSNRSKLQTRCAAKRKLLMDYLRQEGFCGDDNDLVGLVDIGWRCSTQEILRNITGATVEYYYWGVSNGRIAIGRSGSFTSFYYAEDFLNVSRNNKFIEFYICRSTEESTLGYEQTDTGIVPVLNGREDGLMDEEIRQNHEYVRWFARQYRQYACLEEHSLMIFRLLSLRIMYHFMRCPDRNMVAFLSKKLRLEHYGESIPIIIRLYPWTALYIAIFYCLKKKFRSVYKYRQMWVEASLVYTYGKFGKWLVWYRDRLLASNFLRCTAGRLFRVIVNKDH